MRIIVVVGILACLLASLASCDEDTACSPTQRDAQPDACLNAIKATITDRERYWFGQPFINQCGSDPSKWWSEACNGMFMSFTPPASVADILNITGDHIDRFMDVTYTSPPGSYQACDHHYIGKTKKEFTLDPLSLTKTYLPWDLRDMPRVMWPADQGHYYTLVVYDVAIGVVHGLMVNIHGNDTNDVINHHGNVIPGKAEILRMYHGPKNPWARANLYAFMLFDQGAEKIMVSKEWRGIIPAMGQFKLHQFMAAYDLKGPIAVNNLMSWYDPYSVGVFVDRGMNYCGTFVNDALKTDPLHASRPWLPTAASSPNVTASMSVTFHNTELEFTYCCQNHYYGNRTFTLDPTGHSLMTAAETRSENQVMVKVTMNKMGANATVDFAGKHYVMLAVDPDVPRPTCGTEEKPLLHWLAINSVIDATGELKPGKVLQPYGGPKPPDSKTHYYYFMLYEQTGEINLDDASAYVTNGRCLFEVSKFESEHSLKLTAVSWMGANNDDYVNYLNSVNQSQTCAGRPFYSEPCSHVDDSVYKHTQMITNAVANHPRSWLPQNNLGLSVQLGVEFTTEEISFTHCCKKHTFPSGTFMLDPTGNSNVATVKARSGADIKVKVHRMFLNDTKADSRRYTLMAVTPDANRWSEGTSDLPLVHWLAVDNKVNGDDMLEFGQEILPWVGPSPLSDEHHHYYFVLLEQAAEELTLTDWDDYVGKDCGDLEKRCQFDMSRFVENKDLHLAGLSWFTSKNDGYVNYTRTDLPKAEVCMGQPGYSDPCVVPAPSRAAGHTAVTALIVTMGAVVAAAIRM